MPQAPASMKAPDEGLNMRAIRCVCVSFRGLRRQDARDRSSAGYV
jgi:hypothetical protein